jgi:hypothetical protein
MPETDPPAWIPCPACGEFWCTIHRRHAADCDCPPTDEWGDVDPYAPGSSSIGPHPHAGNKDFRGFVRINGIAR